MKLASFFIFSLALHSAAVIAYPISLAVAPAGRFIPVTILSTGEVGGRAENSAAVETSKSPARSAKSSTTKTSPRPTRRIKAAAPIATTTRPPADARPQAAEKPAAFTAAAPEKPLAFFSSVGMNDEDDTLAGFEALAGDEDDQGIAGSGSGPMASQSRSSQGFGWGESGRGSGNGEGRGHGAGSAALPLTPVGFNHTPPPEYPATARADGEEGRVLLRVLVDEEGNSKIVEINRSSGSTLLDRAAADAIKRWRFSPARYGNVPTASWVRIPVEFRLVDARN